MPLDLARVIIEPARSRAPLTTVIGVETKVGRVSGVRPRLTWCAPRMSGEEPASHSRDQLLRVDTRRLANASITVEELSRPATPVLDVGV